MQVLNVFQNVEFPLLLQGTVFPVKLSLAFWMLSHVLGNRASESVMVVIAHVALLSLYRRMMACALRSGSPMKMRSGQIFRRF